MHKSGLIISSEFAEVGRKERDPPCLAFRCMDRSIISPPRRSLCVCLALSLCTSATIFPAFCLLRILRYCHFPLLPSACTPRRAAFRKTVASHSISLFSQGTSRCTRSLVRARRPGTTKCQNLPLHASLRPGTRSYLVGLVLDEAQNFELRSFASCAPPRAPLRRSAFA